MEKPVRSPDTTKEAWPLEFRILGPLEVLDNGREVSIRGRKLQSLLALLLLHAGEVVSRDRLIDDLWGDDPPATAAKTLQVHVSRLRRELGDVVVSLGGGYLIRVEPGRRSTWSASSGSWRRAGGPLRSSSPSVRPNVCARRSRCGAARRCRSSPTSRSRTLEIGRLEDARLDAIEQRVEADLALGPSLRGDPGARAARGSPPLPRASARAAHARALPGRQAGRRPGGVPGRPQRRSSRSSDWSRASGSASCTRRSWRRTRRSSGPSADARRSGGAASPPHRRRGAFGRWRGDWPRLARGRCVVLLAGRTDDEPNSQPFRTTATRSP